MLTLDPSQRLSPGWNNRFQELRDSDVRGPGREFNKKSKGTFQPSWIWLVPQLADHVLNAKLSEDTQLPHGELSIATGMGSELEKSEVANAMCVHWAKCQAQAEHYEEEVALTVEEMGRTLRYFQWKKSWWISLQSSQEQSANPPQLRFNRGYVHMLSTNPMFTRH